MNTHEHHALTQILELWCDDYWDSPLKETLAGSEICGPYDHEDPSLEFRAQKLRSAPTDRNYWKLSEDGKIRGKSECGCENETCVPFTAYMKDTGADGDGLKEGKSQYVLMFGSHALKGEDYDTDEEMDKGKDGDKDEDGDVDTDDDEDEGPCQFFLVAAEEDLVEDEGRLFLPELTGEERRAMLARVIKEGPYDTSWGLRGYKFADTDVLGIVKRLEGNTTVTELNISSNSFTDAGLQEIAKMMEGNSTIVRMNLSGAPCLLVSRTHR